MKASEQGAIMVADPACAGCSKSKLGRGDWRWVRMKTLRSVLFLSLSLCGFGYGEGPVKGEANKAELRILFFDFPHWARLARARSVLRSSSASESETSLAKRDVATARERLPKIRAYFKEGTSIFDYPGILEVARIQLLPPVERSDGTTEYGYRANIGLYLGEEFARSSDFYVDFDSSGMITKIGNIVATH